MFCEKQHETPKNGVKDSFGAFLIEGAHFTKREEYPILEKEMISKDLPLRIIPFKKAINSQEDLSDAFICFYSPDEDFESGIVKTIDWYLNKLK